MTALERMLQEELEEEKKYSNELLVALKQSQTEFTEELQRISAVFESEIKKITRNYEQLLKEELAKNRALLEKYLQSEATEFSTLKSELERLSKALKNT